VTYNKSSLFAQKEEKTKFSNVFEVEKIIYLYIELKCKRTKIPKDIVPFQSK
jgi:hypothetical protein